MKETIIKRWLSLKPIEFSYWFWKQFIQWINQLNQWSRKRKKIQEHKDFYPGSPKKMGYFQSLTHNKDFTKNDQTDQIYNTYPQQEYTAPHSKPLLNLQQTKKPHRVHCVFQEYPCWNLQQVTVIQNPLYNTEMPHCSPQRTTVEPTADQETTQNPLCVSRTPLLKPTTSHSYTKSTV